VPPPPRTAKSRARLGGLVSRLGPDHPRVAEAQQDLEVSKLADHIERVLATAPPLTDEQRSKLAELLRPVRVGKRAAS